MASTLEDNKADLLAKAGGLAARAKGPGGPPADAAAGLLTAYYRHVAPEDVVDRGEVDVYGALASQLKLAQTRPQGTARVRVFTPTVPEHGWSAGGHTVVEIVTDDMPFLVDSMTMALTDRGGGLDHTVHVVIHPLFEAVRDVAGELRDVRVADESQGLGDDNESTGQVDDGGLETVQESWMHIEIDRVTDEGELAEIETRLQRVLRDIRDAVEDWPRMQARLLDIVAELEARPADAAGPRRARRRASRSCAGWPTTTSPSSATASTPSRSSGTSSR